MAGGFQSTPHNTSSLTTMQSPRDDEVQMVSDETRRVVTIIVYGVLCTLVNFVGTIANAINVIVFSKMGFSDPINISLLGISISDLLGLLTLQWLNICINPWFQVSSVEFDPFQVQYLTAGWPHVALARVTSWLTAYITLERCLCVTMPLKVKAILTPQNTTIVVVVVFLSMFLCTCPIYMVNGFGWSFDNTVNRTRLRLTQLRDDYDSMEQIGYGIASGNSYASFIIVIVCTAVLTVKLKRNAKWRAGARAIGDQGNSSGTRDRKIVVMVTMIAALFIVCYLPMTVMYITIVVVPGFGLTGKFENLVHTLNPFVFFLETINHSSNTFIYLKMSSKFRSTLNSFFHK